MNKWHVIHDKRTVKQVNFAGNLISQISQMVQICEIRLPRNQIATNLDCWKVVNFTLTAIVSFQFSWNQVAIKLAIIPNSQKKKKKKNLLLQLTCFTVWCWCNDYFDIYQSPIFYGQLFVTGRQLPWINLYFVMYFLIVNFATPKGVTWGICTSARPLVRVNILFFLWRNMLSVLV